MKEDDLQTLHDKICGKREDDFFGEEELQDMHDAISLYDVLFNKVIKTYYNDRKKWSEMMAASINAMVDRYSADRMVKEYYEKLYR